MGNWGIALGAAADSGMKTYKQLQDMETEKRDNEFKKQQQDRQRKTWEVGDALPGTLAEIDKQYGVGGSAAPTPAAAAPAQAAPAAAIPAVAGARPSLPQAPPLVSAAGATTVEPVEAIASKKAPTPSLPKQPPADYYRERSMAYAKAYAVTKDPQYMQLAADDHKQYVGKMKGAVVSQLMTAAAKGDKGLEDFTAGVQDGTGMEITPITEGDAKGQKIYKYGDMTVVAANATQAAVQLSDMINGEDGDTMVAHVLKFADNNMKSDLNKAAIAAHEAATRKADADAQETAALIPGKKALLGAQANAANANAGESAAGIRLKGAQTDQVQAETGIIKATGALPPKGSASDSEWKTQVDTKSDPDNPRWTRSNKQGQVQIQIPELGGAWVDSGAASQLPKILADPSVKLGKVKPVASKAGKLGFQAQNGLIYSTLDEARVAGASPPAGLHPNGR